MKSRYFSIPGLLVDVSEIVGVVVLDDSARIVFREGPDMHLKTSADAQSIIDAVEEYEIESQSAWTRLPSPDADDTVTLTGAGKAALSPEQAWLAESRTTAATTPATWTPGGVSV